MKKNEEKVKEIINIIDSNKKLLKINESSKEAEERINLLLYLFFS